MIRSRLTNLGMAVGLVLLYFFINGLSSNIKEVYLHITGREDTYPVEAQQITPLEVTEEITDEDEFENLLDTLVKTKEIVETVAPYTQVEDQAFYAPSQVERPRLVTTPSGQKFYSEIPIHLVIPAINLSAPIIGVQPEIVSIGGSEFQQWLSPDEYAAGWHETSAKLGETGNTVLNGHHNVSGEVFGRLVELVEGNQIGVLSEQHLFRYQITNKMILPEKYEPLEVRISNAQWILPSEDERLTLITCWPHESNTHRLIIVARPIAVEEIPDIDEELLPRIFEESSSSDDG